MTAIAEFTLPPTAFPLGRVFEEYPTVRLELDCVVPTRDTMLPYFWVISSDGRLAEILALFESFTEIRSVTLLEALDGKGLFEIDWHPGHLGLLDALARSDVTVLSAKGSAHGWLFELRSANRSEFATFQQHCRQLGISVSLAHVSELSELRAGTVHCLTDEQREALELAYSEGYYDDPRGTTLEALADQLGISRQALSARLRRGYRALIEQGVLYHDRQNN